MKMLGTSVEMSLYSCKIKGVMVAVKEATPSEEGGLQTKKSVTDVACLAARYRFAVSE